MLKLKRVYDPPASADGCRILVDRLWPRGVSKDEARIDVWVKDSAPSTKLRKWFNHDPAKWPEFQRRYKEELRETGSVGGLRSEVKKHKTVTLVYAAKDKEHNNAVVLKGMLGK